MARKRRVPSPTPPPPSPPQQTSSSESDTTEDEEESPCAQMPPQSPQSHSAAAESDGSEEESDSDAQPESDAEEEEESSDSEPEAPEPVLKKTLAGKKPNTSSQPDKKKPAPEPAPAPSGSKLKEKGKVDGPQTEPDPDEEEEGESSESEQQDKTAPPAKKTVAQHNKKRLAPEVAPSNKTKKAKADAGIVEHEATPTGNGKHKAEAEPEKAPHVQTRSATANKLGGKLDKSGRDPSSSSKSAQVHRWSNKDTIKILETLAAYVEREANWPENKVFYPLVTDYLERADCNLSDLYEKVRGHKRKYERGFVPVGDYECQVYQLSDAIWGQKAQEAIAAAAAASRGGQAEAVDVEAERNGKINLSKEDTATATQNGDALRNGKGRKADKEASTGNHNTGAGNEEESHEEDAGGGAAVQGIQRNNGLFGNQNGGTGTEHAEGRAIVQGGHRDFHELQKLYPILTDCVERLDGPNHCRETLKMAFRFIGDEEAKTLESSMEAQKKLEALTEACRLNIKVSLLNMLLDKAD